MITLLRRFLSDRSGNFAMTFGLTAFPVMVTMGLAIDYSIIQRERWRLQETAESSALYAVKELEKAGVTENDLQRTGEDVAFANLMLDGKAEFELDKSSRTIRVDMSRLYQPTFLALVHPDLVTIAVVSEVLYSIKYKGMKCFMSLSETGRGVLNLNGNAIIDAEDCAVQVNSSSDYAVDLNGNGTWIRSANNCFVGGVESGLNRIYPPPEPECGVMQDPFDEWETPVVGACNFNDFRVSGNRAATLQPGVYCGGISIGSGASVTLSPGVYIIKDGEFKTTGSVTMVGNGVTFFFTGEDVALNFSGGTTFNLTAHDEGPLAGFLVFFAVEADKKLASAFSGNSSTYFEGILYFGRRDVTVNGEGDVNTGSPYSALIADTVTLNGNAQINFKVDEDATVLPVPDELYNKAIVARLIQ
jgi:hypothetical protein